MYSHVSVLDQRRIQNLVKHLRWIFLRKLLMALARQLFLKSSISDV